ncbi:MAG: serine/threonine protein kinase [Planctomycetes bacterium]|nr:serine/threonine protein kinase [Planctomycetota bacterium]
MLRFEDLMAARILDRQVPDKRLAILGAVGALRASHSPKSLLSSLVEGEVLTMEQARWVHAQVERYKRSRGVAVYSHLLAREGLPAERVRRLVEQAGPEADLNALGDAVVAAGQLPPHREQQLRFQARLAADRDQASQVQAWLAAHPSTTSEEQTQVDMVAPSSLTSLSSVPAEGLSGGGAAAPDPAASGALRLPPDPGASAVLRLGEMAAALAGPVQEEARRIVRGTLSDADDELPGPQFRIPDWIDMSDPRTGKQLAGYRILGRVGAGAMGTVYLVDRQDEPTRPVALKLLPKDADADAKGRFKREILANSFFSHPGVIEILDAGETEQGHPFMAMEFFDGSDLSVVLDAEKRLPARRALHLGRQVLEALGACHAAGVVHRDIKPANILVSRDGEVAKLMDFGIALVRELGEFEGAVFRSMEGGVTGTPEFMSPEQAGGDTLGEASDLYSLGCVLYLMLSGRLPFESESSQGFISCHLLEDPLPLAQAHADTRALPRELLDLVDALLRKAPDERPKGAKAVVEVIDQVLPRLRDKTGRVGLWGMLWGR